MTTPETRCGAEPPDEKMWPTGKRCEKPAGHDGTHAYTEPFPMGSMETHWSDDGSLYGVVPAPSPTGAAAGAMTEDGMIERIDAVIRQGEQAARHSESNDTTVRVDLGDLKRLRSSLVSAADGALREGVQKAWEAADALAEGLVRDSDSGDFGRALEDRALAACSLVVLLVGVRAALSRVPSSVAASGGER